MKRLKAFLALSLSAVLISATAPARTSAGPHPGQPPAAQAGPPLVFRNQVVFDQQGLGLEVLRMLVPKDWAFSGGLTWDFMKNPPVGYIAYTITSPDGNSVIEQLPHMNMYWSPDLTLQYSFAQMGNSILQPLGAIDFLQSVFIPQARPGVSGLKILETQALVAQRLVASGNMTLNLFAQISPMSPCELRADAGRVKVEYTANGRRMVEDFGVGITYNITNVPTLSGMTVPSVMWMPIVTAFRCPAEEMPSKIRQFEIALRSRFDNPVWTVAYTRLCALVTREQLQQQQAIFARYRQIHQTLEECSDIVWQTLQNKSAADDRIFDSYSQALRGVDTYVDPVNNRSVDLPTGYENAWTNGTDYVFSDSPSFNPSALPGGNWQKMARKR